MVHYPRKVKSVVKEIMAVKCGTSYHIEGLAQNLLAFQPSGTHYGEEDIVEKVQPSKLASHSGTSIIPENIAKVEECCLYSVRASHFMNSRIAGGKICQPIKILLALLLNHPTESPSLGNKVPKINGLDHRTKTTCSIWWFLKGVVVKNRCGNQFPTSIKS